VSVVEQSYVCDPRRLASLRRAQLLDAPVEEAFDRLTRLATRLLGVPVSLVSLVDDERQFFLSAVGLEGAAAEERETPLSHSFCRLVVESREPLVVDDARADVRVCDNPAIDGLGVSAYAGVPLVAADGEVLGSLCAIDSEPRAWLAQDVELLRELAGALVAEIDARVERLDRQQQTQAHLDALVAQLPVVSYVSALGPARCLLDISPQIESLLGFTREEWVADPDLFLQRVHPADVSRVAEHSRSSREAGTTFECEYRLLARDEREVWVIDRMAVVRDAGGEPFAFRGVLLDVTDRREAERELREREERYRLTLETANDAFVAIDGDGLVTDWNVQAEQTFGHAAGDAVGRSMRDLLIPARFHEAHDAGLRRYRATREERVFFRPVELVALHRDGRELPVEVTIWPFEVDGQLHFAAFLRDLTERKRFDAQLQQAQKLEALGQLAGNVAHDFNNVLAAIGMRSELEASRSSGSLGAIFAEITAGVAQGQALTSQLLSFARRRDAVTVPLDLNESVRRIEALLRTLVGGRIELAIELASAPAAVVGDPAQFDQVLMNLVVNARDAIDGRGTITVTTASDGSTCILSVADTGSGIDETTRAQIFEPFFTTKPDGAGTGLGLAMVFAAAREAGGSVAVASELGSGSVFTLTLPAADD